MPYSDTEALNKIHRLLDAVEWSPDTLELIALAVEKTGRPIRDLDEGGVTWSDEPTERPNPGGIS